MFIKYLIIIIISTPGKSGNRTTKKVNGGTVIDGKLKTGKRG
jgi:hypothetical protein